MNRLNDSAVDYKHFKSEPDPTAAYIWPVVDKILERIEVPKGSAIDVGCGTGATTDFLRRKGLSAIGIEPSPRGVEIASRAFPATQFAVGNAYEDLAGIHGRFGLVASFEVIEHLYDPAKFLQRLYELTVPSGYCLISTPYHGYFKNLALAIGGKWDAHLAPDNLGGHIKFFSLPQLRKAMSASGYQVLESWRVGRSLPVLAKSMMVLARKPDDTQ